MHKLGDLVHAPMNCTTFLCRTFLDMEIKRRQISSKIEVDKRSLIGGTAYILQKGVAAKWIKLPVSAEKYQSIPISRLKESYISTLFLLN